MPADDRRTQPQGRPDSQQSVCERPCTSPPVQLSRRVWSDSRSWRRPAARVQGPLQGDLHLHPKDQRRPLWEQVSRQDSAKRILHFLGLVLICHLFLWKHWGRFAETLSKGCTCCDVHCILDTLPTFLLVCTCSFYSVLLKIYGKLC